MVVHSKAQANPAGNRKVAGFTLIELMVVTAIMGVLATIALPHYHSLRDKANVARAENEVRALEIDIATYRAGLDVLPPNLAAIGRAGMLDPWGNPYQYLVSAGSPPGQLRKDRFLTPLNSDYDLYSMGVDGQSQPPLTAGASKDDIVRCDDGSYVGLAANY